MRFCEQAAKEKYAKKLIALVREINRSLQNQPSMAHHATRGNEPAEELEPMIYQVVPGVLATVEKALLAFPRSDAQSRSPILGCSDQTYSADHQY